MFMLKISSFLVTYAAVVCQIHSSNAAPVRPGSESLTDRFALMDYEARRLLSAVVKNTLQMTEEELEPNDDSRQGRFLSKRCSNLSKTLPGAAQITNVPADGPGKKRSLLEGNQFTSYEETFNSI